MEVRPHYVCKNCKTVIALEEHDFLDYAAADSGLRGVHFFLGAKNMVTDGVSKPAGPHRVADLRCANCTNHIGFIYTHVSAVETIIYQSGIQLIMAKLEFVNHPRAARMEGQQQQAAQPQAAAGMGEQEQAPQQRAGQMEEQEQAPQHQARENRSS